ncbi:succinate dehydrogenase cytochrome b560 subunit, mitochondrial [Odontesthes bonariensis]|uniref:succinate dehydrogenase cytochrome b560 subunit, mitochondrial n=1 Tax=Odontesthes bonariensis TaxID=219752 RepID=UPI003F584CCA
MALLLRTFARPGVCLSKLQYSVLYRHAAPMGSTAKDEMNKFWSKNARLNRPMSPHLTIYKWSVPMVMSICFRGTGVGLTGAISAFGVAALVLPGNYPDYLDLIHSLAIGPYLIGLAKFGLAFPISYHTYNGIRHLWWDIGKGFRIPEVYRTGYTVIGLSVITSIAIAMI